MKLSEFIENQITKSYFSGLLDRYCLANSFMETFRNECCDKDGAVKDRNVPFYNPDNIIIEGKNEPNLQKPEFKVEFPKDIKYSKGETFKNAEFADIKSLTSKFSIGAANDCETVANKYINEEKFVVTTISRLLFIVYFGFHPLCGREYYENLDVSEVREHDYFTKKHKFIFEIQDNENRFVNGYENLGYELWSYQLKEQKALFLNAFNEKYDKFEDFFKDWKKVYSDFVKSELVTPCGKKLNAITYSERYSLVTSDNYIGNGKIRCRNCCDDLMKRCATCTVESENREAFLTVQKIKIIPDQNGTPNLPKEKEMYIYSGQTITEEDLYLDGIKVNLEVIASKRPGILGLKNLSKLNIAAECGKQERIYKHDQIIALLPDTEITVFGDCKIRVPILTTQQKPAAKPNPTTAPTKADDSKTDKKSENNFQKTTSETQAVKSAENSVKTDVKSVSNLQKTIPETQVVKSTENSVKANVQTAEAPKNTVETKVNSSASNLNAVSKNDNFDIKKFKKIEISSEKYGYIIGNIEKILSSNIDLPENVIYPTEIVDVTGTEYYPKGLKIKKLPSDVITITDKIKRPLNPHNSSLEIEILLNLCNTIKELHEKKLCLNLMSENTIVFNEKLKKAFIYEPRWLCKEGEEQKYRSLYFAVPESLIKKATIELKCSADCFTLAEIMFIFLYKTHPFGTGVWGYENGGRSDRQDKYIYNPKFCFEKDLKTGKAVAESFSNEVKDKWTDTPQFIRELFNNTFSGVDKFNKSEEGLKKLVERRPDIKQWCESLEKWLKDLKFNGR